MSESNSENEAETTSRLNAINHAHHGPILGILTLFLVMIIVGLIIWGGTLEKNTPVASLPEPVIVNNEPETPRAVVDTQILETLSTSDELAAISADLGSTNLDIFDADVQAIDAEFNTDIEATQ